MQVAIGQNHKTAVQRFSVFARLFLADQWVFTFRLGLKNHYRKAFLVKKQEVCIPLAGRLKISAHRIDLCVRE